MRRDLLAFAAAAACAASSPAWAGSKIVHWSNPSGAIQTVQAGTGNKFHRVASMPIEVTKRSTVSVTGAMEGLLESCGGSCTSGRGWGMGGIVRVGIVGTPTIQSFSALLGGVLAGASQSYTSIMPITVTNHANLAPGKYEAYIELYGNEGANFAPLKYKVKSITAHVVDAD
jgi:hypothetical protein